MIKLKLGGQKWPCWMEWVWAWSGSRLPYCHFGLKVIFDFDQRTANQFIIMPKSLATIPEINIFCHLGNNWQIICAP